MFADMLIEPPNSKTDELIYVYVICRNNIHVRLTEKQTLKCVKGPQTQVERNAPCLFVAVGVADFCHAIMRRLHLLCNLKR